MSEQMNGEATTPEEEPALEPAEAMPMAEDDMAMEQAMMAEQAEAEQQELAAEQAEMTAQTEAEEQMMATMEQAERLHPLSELRDPAGLEPHPFADLLPLMRAGEFADLKESIELDGLQNPVILFQDKILDGRNRCTACRELGMWVPAMEYTGTEDQALQYVLSSNQHRRDLDPSQRAVVAVDLLPRISEDVNQKRIEKLRQTLQAKADGECQPNLANTQTDEEKPVTSRVIAADIMGVSHGYVGLAKRLKEASPDLFERVRAGDLTLRAAIAEIDGTASDPETLRIKAVRTKLNKLFGTIDDNPDFLDRLESLVAEFA